MKSNLLNNPIIHAGTALRLGALLIPLLFSSCNKFLDQEPRKQVTIQTIEQLQALLNPQGPSFDQLSETNTIENFGTDHNQVSRELYRNNASIYSSLGMSYYVHDTEQIAAQPSDQLWTGQYRNILIANQVLTSVDAVSGTALQKTAIKAEAHFMRAYAYWMLVNYYCQPYRPGVNDSEIGLPLKKTISYEETVQRASLKETYDFIMADIVQAQQTPVDDVQDRLRWRISRKGISAFLSRYYLLLGDYEQVIRYADEALQSQSVQLYDYHNIVPIISYPVGNSPDPIVFSSLSFTLNAEFVYWQEIYYARFRAPGPSVDPNFATTAYDMSNDLRYKWLMVPNGMALFNVFTPKTYRYMSFTLGSLLITGPTRPEVLLNKAEAQARLSRVAEAIQTVNLLRPVRMNTPAPLVATTRDDAIKAVLGERSREMPFTMRWLDIRRFSVNDYAADDVVVNRDFFHLNNAGIPNVTEEASYTLPVGSRKYALPINNLEIQNSRGQIQQNTY